MLAWTVALASFLGAMFFSEVMDLEPCVLCWYQRIAMFPLVLILGIGAYGQDRSCLRYALPLAAAGWLLAGYHWLLYKGVIPKDLQPCGKGASCADVKLEIAGFITIPLLSLTAFSLILLLLVAAHRKFQQ
ncbi:disulfide bond formation protein C [Pseudorhodoferax aquiterrae]|uniref:Disulfide bond formation protein C n=2 Tax=Pseudorhodoferax aquiterrae TaxID=747304 RepID=A0ABQ3G4H1_9BURK|nr:disulfide bond formation protein C [Pseudorhodoferax aquiterrae]